jgi:phosphatidylinositol dimannoside acyltransferase
MSKKESRVEELIRFFGFHAVTTIVRYLPFKVLYILADLLGCIGASDKRDVIVEYLQCLLGCTPEEAERIFQAAMRQFRKDVFELWKIPEFNAATIERITLLQGVEHLEAGLRAGRGVVIPVTHFGSWKIVPAALGYRGYKVHQLAGKPTTFIQQHERASHNLILAHEFKCEQLLPVNFIYVEDAVLHKKLFEVLRSNEIVVAALDGILGEGKRCQADFLHGKINLSRGPVNLAQKTGAALVPLFPVRQDDDRHRLEFHPSLNVEEQGRAFPEAWLRQFGELLSARVLERPEHYARWLYSVHKYPLQESGAIITWLLEQDRDRNLVCAGTKKASPPEA